MKKKEKIKLSKEIQEEMKVEMKNYFLNERDEELGDLAATLLLDFIIENLGPQIYNQGVSDSYKFIQEKSEDLLSLQI